MLTTIEKILFTLLALASVYFAFATFVRIRRIIKRGSGRLATDRFDDGEEVYLVVEPRHCVLTEDEVC